MPSGVVRSTSRRERDGREAGHHEHVVVREVVTGARVGAGAYGAEVKVTLRSPRALSETPVLLVHGWGGSFEATWRRSGFTELLADAGRPVIGVDLLGHGEAPEAARSRRLRRPDGADRGRAPRRAGRRRRLLARRASRCCASPPVARAVPPDRRRRHRAQRVRARRRAARAHPRRRRGHGRPRRQPRPPVRAVRRPSPATTPSPSPRSCAGSTTRRSPPRRSPPSPAPCSSCSATATSPAPPIRSSRRCPTPRLVTLRNVDHFATPESFGFIDAALEFLDAVPA